jgi:hypothetical protein
MLVDHFAMFLSDNSFFASMLRMNVKSVLFDFLVASSLFLVLQRCSELLGYMKEGNAHLWVKKAEEYISQLEIGHEILLSLPSLNNTLVIRAINESDRDIAIISLDDKSYFATVEQHVNYGSTDSSAKRRTAAAAAVKREGADSNQSQSNQGNQGQGGANEESEDNLAGDFEKNFIAVYIYTIIYSFHCPLPFALTLWSKCLAAGNGLSVQRKADQQLFPAEALERQQPRDEGQRRQDLLPHYRAVRAHFAAAEREDHCGMPELREQRAVEESAVQTPYKTAEFLETHQIRGASLLPSPYKDEFQCL